jgi:hypothetical protein
MGLADGPLIPRYSIARTGARGAVAATLNSSDFHKTAIFLQSLEVTLQTVALLTGRVYQDGLGGLRAVLFSFLAGRTILFQVGAHNLHQFVGCQSLLGTGFFRVDHVEADVAFE